METPTKLAAMAPIIRDCNICNYSQALYDAPTIWGSWAYLCEACYQHVAAIGAHAVGFKIVDK